MNKLKLASLFGVALAISSVPVSAGVEYDDTDLHRSDEMVRFDRAYRAGLNDGTTTIIYSDSKAPGALPDQPVSSRDKDQSSASRYRDQPAPYQDQDSIPEKMQDPSRAEMRRYPSQSGQVGNATGRDDCDCEPAKSTAPKSEPVRPSVAADRDSEATMREKIEAVRQARELLRKSRQGSDTETAKHSDGDDQADENKYGSETPRLLGNAESSTCGAAPLTPYQLEPDFVRNQEVSVEIGAATIEEIAGELMPCGWRVRLSTADQEAHESQYEFVSSDPREVALRKLLLGTGLGYKFFFDLKDDHGNPSPLLVISEVNS